MKYLTPSEVNRAIKKAGIEDVTIVRGKGYYWFDANESIPSIYEWPRLTGEAQVIVDHVREHVERDKAERADAPKGKKLYIPG